MVHRIHGGHIKRATATGTIDVYIADLTIKVIETHRCSTSRPSQDRLSWIDFGRINGSLELRVKISPDSIHIHFRLWRRYRRRLRRHRWHRIWNGDRRRYRRHLGKWLRRRHFRDRRLRRRRRRRWWIWGYGYHSHFLDRRGRLRMCHVPDDNAREYKTNKCLSDYRQDE